MNFLRIAILSDSHLIKDKDFLGINTYDSLTAIVDLIKLNIDRYDIIMILGDLVQDQNEDSFEFFNIQLSRLKKKKLIIRGNHDIKENLPINDFFEYNEDIISNNWILIPIESYVKNKIYGEVSDSKLWDIRSKLINQPSLNGLIYMHHNLFETNSDWLDIHITRNFAHIRSELSKISNLILVISGHIHQYTKNIISNLTFLSIPSTSAQFTSSTKEFTLDKVNPGYMELELYDNGEFKYNIIRTKSSYGIPDISPKPY